MQLHPFTGRVVDEVLALHNRSDPPGPEPMDIDDPPLQPTPSTIQATPLPPNTPSMPIPTPCTTSHGLPLPLTPP